MSATESGRSERERAAKQLVVPKFLIAVFVLAPLLMVASTVVLVIDYRRQEELRVQSHELQAEQNRLMKEMLQEMRGPEQVTGTQIRGYVTDYNSPVGAPMDDDERREILAAFLRE